MIYTCLSVRQPWASLIIYGFKDIENRTWETMHRGPLLIHASAKWDGGSALQAARAMSPVPVPDRNHPCYQFGGFIGIVDLVGFPEDAVLSPWADPYQYQWKLANPRPIKFIPWKGQLGLFKADVEIVEAPHA